MRMGIRDWRSVIGYRLSVIGARACMFGGAASTQTPLPITDTRNPIPEREAGRVGRAEVVSKVRCVSLRSAARRTRPVSAVCPGLATRSLWLTSAQSTQGPWLLMATSRFSASGFSDESRTLRFHAPQAMQTSFASPYEPGKRRTLSQGPSRHPTSADFLNDGLAGEALRRVALRQAQRDAVGAFPSPLFHRSDACRAGRCAHISKLRSSSKSSRVRARALYAESPPGRIDFLSRVCFQRVTRKRAWIEGAAILVFARLGAFLHGLSTFTNTAGLNAM